MAMFRGSLVVALGVMTAVALPQHPTGEPKPAVATPQSYSRKSPHWPHIRTMVTDYHSSGVKDAAQQRAERDWIADHADHVLGEVDRGRNPNVRLYSYALNLTSLQGRDALNITADMQKWFASHRDFSFEDAFLHDDRLCPPPQPVSASCRLVMKRWNMDRWIFNPGDPGLRAYLIDRFARAAGHWDGFFFDEHDSGGMMDEACGKGNGSHSREYLGLTDSCAAYFDTVVKLLEMERAALGPGKRIIINIAEYTRDFDLRMAVAAGGVQLELVNNPGRETEPRWDFIDSLLAKGAFVEYSAPDPGNFPKDYPRGNYASPAHRWRLALLANYYMVVPDPPDNLVFENERNFSEPFSRWWIKAQEVDIGRPLGRRRVYLSGVDGAGQKYRVYLREFERAYVVINPMILWSDKDFGDRSAVVLNLPGGKPLIPLFAEGNQGPPVTRIALRHAEAAILLKP